ncbi:MAG: hypothetical protein COU09_00065 [Candidatus Harrisonbacteria bacterium CG10_big_fil_rev_8_21_14_0_10_44_23]|uniref:histidine kinase n=1 Tax=Candidatus Harrisonbacteria bacterium CG10_big_fil_rev_8_21_14_0_10_44_23 TaxID=1974585 RepID=A0A2H0USP4_9BACT|nr:MAG: hypothetical protein COU09_00065 [Candidatus Harrisonbacteria bacterium CG10_big_fil_rev_8_21_14_0_10_44_23]
MTKYDDQNKNHEREKEELRGEVAGQTKELKEQVDFSNTLLDALSDLDQGMGIVDPTADKFVYVNKALTKILGYSREEILKFDSILDITPSEEMDHLKERQRRRAKGEQISNKYDTAVVGKDGKKVYLEVSVKPIGDPDNLKLIGLIRDISEEKDVQGQLTDAQKKLEEMVAARTEELNDAVLEIKEVLNNITDAYIRLNKKGAVVDVNRQAEKLLKKKKGELCSKNFWSEFPQIKESQLYKSWNDICGGNKGVDYEEFWKPINRWVEVHAYPMEDSDVTIYLRDIQAKKMAEEEVQARLRDSEAERAKDEALLTSIGEAVVAVNRNGKIIFSNGAAQRWFGWGAKELHNNNVDELIPLIDERGKVVTGKRRPMKKAMEQRMRVSEVGFSVRQKHGSSLPVSLTAAPIINKGEVIGAVSVYRDIRKEREIDRAKSEFVALASHQLRTPLTITSWYTEKLASVTDDKARKKYIKELQTANVRMINLVDALLNASRLELGTLGTDPERFSIADLADRVLDDLKPIINKKRLRLRREYDKELKEITTDKKLFGIILENLLSNAVKYTDELGEVRLKIEKNESSINIAVRDTGFGIPIAQHKKIFQKMFRADNARERESDGTGLGLYIVHSIVKQYGGRVWFESEEGKGSEFFVTIPLKEMGKNNVKDGG